MYDYSLRFNVTFNEDLNDLYMNNGLRIVSYAVEQLSELSKYRKFLSVQNVVDNHILRTLNGGSGSIQMSASSQQVPGYEEQEFAKIAKDNIDFYLLLPYIVLFSRMVYKILVEKERKIREGMKMMGMSLSSFYLSWYL